MRTLYVRIIATTMIIMIASAFIAFIASNVYYHNYLKPQNDAKVTKVAKNIVSVYQENENQNIASYLMSMTHLGYTFYMIDQDGNSRTFGESFKTDNIENEDVSTVLKGDTYHGIADFPWGLMVTGFFDNELKNTIGVPINVEGETQALFLRPNTQQQFGEMRIFLAVLLILTLLFSFLLVLVSTRFIVKPIRDLTKATKKIAGGNYHVKLKRNRRDEIGRLANDFSKMSTSLSQTEEKRQAFVSNVSHEIQSPLTSIQGFSQALREEELPEEDRSRYLSIIEKESRRLSLLSKQLLTLSFLDSEMDHNELTSYDLLEQLRDIVSTTEWQWRKKEITIEMEAVPTTIYGDRKLLHQVWMNLLTNAIHYTSPGGTISIRIEDGKSNIGIVFSDTGIGISEHDLPQVFDRFYKADKARTRTKTSMGLGLSIVKKIIELHKGTIMVNSEVGVGTTFEVIIPKS